MKPETIAHSAGAVRALFPRLFFITNGPWMTTAAYAVRAAIVIAIGVWLARQLPGTKRPIATSPATTH